MKGRYKVARYDYRRDYKNMTLEQLRITLDKLNQRVLDSVASGDTSSYDDAMKRASYVEGRIKKLEL